MSFRKGRGGYGRNNDNNKRSKYERDERLPADYDDNAPRYRNGPPNRGRHQRERLSVAEQQKQAASLVGFKAGQPPPEKSFNKHTNKVGFNKAGFDFLIFDFLIFFKKFDSF